MRIAEISLSNSSLSIDTITGLYLYGTTSAPATLFERVKTLEYLDGLTAIETGNGPIGVVLARADANPLLDAGAGASARSAAS